MAKKKSRGYIFQIKHKPKERVSYITVLREVERRTGYRYKDIREVFLCAIDVIIEQMCEKKLVRIPGLGMLFPYIKKGHWANDMKGGTESPGRIWIPSKWIFRMQPNPTLTRKLADVELTEEEEKEFFNK
jgi:nucleoid DNA-binding protein